MFNFNSPVTFKQFITTPKVERKPSVDPYDSDIRDHLERSGHAHLAQYEEVKSHIQKPFNKEGK